MLGKKLGWKLGAALIVGQELGPNDGISLGVELGALLGVKLGKELGALLGEALGVRLGTALGDKVGLKLLISSSAKPSPVSTPSSVAANCCRYRGWWISPGLTSLTRSKNTTIILEFCCNLLLRLSMVLLRIDTSRVEGAQADMLSS